MGVEGAAGGLMGDESRESRGRFESWGIALFEACECPAEGLVSREQGVSWHGDAASRETQHSKLPAQGLGKPSLDQMHNWWEGLTQMVPAECPGSAVLQLCIR